MDYETEIELDDVDLFIAPGARWPRAFRLGVIKAYVEYSVENQQESASRQWYFHVPGWTLKKVEDDGGEHPLTSGPLFDLINTALHATHEEVIIRHCEDAYAYQQEIA